MGFLDFYKHRPEPQERQPGAPGGFWTEFTSGGGYAASALQREADEVRRAPEGRRNHTLNAAAFSVGQLVAGGALDAETARAVLMDAAMSAGLTRLETERTIASGFRGGAATPRGVPEKTLYVPGHVAAAQPEPQDDDGWSSRTVAGGSFVLDVPESPPAVWGAGQRVLWAQGEALMLCGPAGVGKTTLAVQLVAARLGIGDEVLGLPVIAGRRVLYLAMDRPPQIARAMSRLFSEADRARLDKHLVVWKGPPPRDLAKNPDVLLAMCEKADADSVIVDSVKDAAVKLSDDEVGGSYNRARQRVLAGGIEVLELHHQRKAGGENKRPAKLDDVYGSTWLTAGAGSVVLLWGEPGDPVVELHHLKQPAEVIGPWTVVHDQARGTSRVDRQPETLELVRYQGRTGMTAKLLAKALMVTGGEPGRNDIERARRKLENLERDGLLTSVPGHRGGRPGEGETTYFLAEDSA